MTDQLQRALLQAPDPAYPDYLFRDGNGVGCVRVLPVYMPTWGTKATRFDLETGIFLIAAALIRRMWWRRIRHDYDDRWKVIAARSGRRVPYFSRTYAIGFADTEDEADRMQLCMLRDWVTNGYSNATALGPRQRRRLRLESAPVPAR